ncbi:AAA family ATPase [Bosea sp. 2KB_26]|uniref:AAA family ATPase n=1 Tax=Bosea sp. 2KB_26 TaxID=3237475 RepID=UPI003F92CAC1
MFLRRLEIEDFRKLRSVVIGDLQDGLNVISGDNEAGKSTILAALRAAFFERHRVGGEAAQAMLPYNQNVRPQVKVDFELNGQAWSLRKAFCQKPEAELIGANERHIGDAADDRLAELFGFTPPGRGASKPQDHQGIFGLLWVEQGLSHQALGIGAGRDSLSSALESEVGQVIGGERGRALIAAAEARRSTYWDKRYKPRGDYKALLDDVDALSARREEMSSRLAAHDSKVGELARKREIIARYHKDASLEKALSALASAQEAMVQAEMLETIVADARRDTTRCKAETEAAAERLSSRQTLVKMADAARAALAQATHDAEDAKSLVSRLERTTATTTAALAQARAARAATDEALAAVQQAIDRSRALHLLTRLELDLRSAEEADSKRMTALAAAAAITVTKAEIDTLERAAEQVAKARARLEAASVRIEFKPNAGQSVSSDGKPISPGAPLLLAKDATIELEGFGQLVVHPGGGVDDLAQTLSEAERVFQSELRKTGCASFEAARSQVLHKAEAIAEAELQRKLISATAPKGLEALRQETQNQRAIATQFAARDIDAGEASDESRARAVETQRIGIQDEKAAEDAAARHRAQHDKATLEAAVWNERLNAAITNANEKVRDLIEARSKISDAELQASFDAAQSAHSTAKEVEQAAIRALEQANPEAASLALSRARNAAENIRADLERTAREARDLEIELRALGRDGLGEQLAEIEGQIALKQKQLGTTRAQADGARLLYETLADAQRESKDRWLGPVRERVAPYLRLLHPDSQIVLNEDTLEIEHFVRAGIEEPFRQLSMGAREQTAVITRLALADILRGFGQPSIVILDDALVNTDEERLDRMHLVLNKAAGSLQILILTCREKDFIQLGAPIRRI